MATQQHELRLHGIKKRFGPVRALENVDFSLRAGEVHALLGENGAGKSTLMKILFGLYRPDAGTIHADGRPVRIAAPTDAMRLGLGFVQQHFSLVGSLTVCENVVLGVLPSKAYNPQKIRKQIQQYIDTLGLALDAGVLVSSLAVGEKQRVEIVKALYRNAAFIIFDEPTSVLTPQEIQTLFATILTLKQTGKGIIFITHKLQEVLQISDRITVLRAGENVGTVATADATVRELAEMMVGKRMPPIEATTAAHPKDVRRRKSVLQVTDLSIASDPGGVGTERISFDLHTGEILGVAGVDGSGQRELAEALLGLRAIAAGDIRWNLPVSSPRGNRRIVGFIPQDRQQEAFIADFSVAENLLLEHSDAAAFRRGLFLSPHKIADYATKVLRDFEVRSKGPDQPVRELSGGNQQKLLVGRALSISPQVLVVMNPTWSVDIVSTAAIHNLLRQMRDNGGAILLFSTDLDEIYTLCDRFFVLFQGRQMGWSTPAQEQTQVGLWMAGVASPQSQPDT